MEGSSFLRNYVMYLEGLRETMKNRGHGSQTLAMILAGYPQNVSRHKIWKSFLIILVFQLIKLWSLVVPYKIFIFTNFCTIVKIGNDWWKTWSETCAAYYKSILQLVFGKWKISLSGWVHLIWWTWKLDWLLITEQITCVLQRVELSELLLFLCCLLLFIIIIIIRILPTWTSENEWMKCYFSFQVRYSDISYNIYLVKSLDTNSAK